MLTRLGNSRIAWITCWLVLAAASTDFIGVVSAEITYCPTNRTVVANTACTAILEDFTGELQASDPAAVVTQDPLPGTNLSLGTNLLTFSVTETNGVSTCTMFVVVLDTTGPVLAGLTNKTVECGSAWTFDEPVVADECSGTNVTVMILETVTNGMTLTRTWAANDPAGNTNTASQSVTLADTTGPVLAGLTNKTAECGSAWTFDEPVVADECSGTNVTVMILETLTNGMTLTRTWAANDPAGNTNTASQSVTLADTTGPVLAGLTNKTVEYTTAWSFDLPSATDACGTNTLAVLNTTTNWTCGVGYVATRTWQAVDASGNSATCTQVVAVVDTTPPVILGPSNLTVECSSLWSFGTPVAADKGLGGVLVYDNSVNDLTSRLEVNTNEAGSEIILEGAARYLQDFSFEFWSTNVTGSVLFEGPEVTVRLRFYANNGAAFNGYPAPGTLLFDSGDFWLGPVTTPRATVVYDEYDLGVFALVPLTVALPASFTWTVQFGGLGANDRAGVDLYSPPVIGNSYGDYWLRTNGGWELMMNPTVDLDFAAQAWASTNQVVITVLSTVTNATGNGFAATRIWRATDACGNFSDWSQAVTVVDTTPPVLGCGTNKTVECGSVWAFDEPLASDGCSGTNVTVSVLGTETNELTLTRTWVASDEAGNTNTCSQSVTLVDTTPPVLAGGTNKTVECGSAWNFDEPEAADGCSGTNVTLVILETVTNGMTLTRTWAANDPAGNTNTASQSVTLADTTGPVITLCPTNRSLIVSENCSVVLPDFMGELTASDSCSVVFVSQDPPPGSEVGVGQYVVTFTASDASSNNSTCALLLTVNPPAGANTNISISEFMAKNTIGITDENGTYSDWIEIHNAGICPVNLDGWALTDNVTLLTKWRLPATNIAGGQFLVVWASDKNRRIPGAPLHTNFKLSDEGEYLALVQPDGVTVATQFSPAFPPQLPDVSFGLPTDGVTNNFLASPTPGMPNSPGTNFVGSATNITISEFMAKNTFTLADENGTYSDWIEVHNAGSSPVNLDGWALTDNASQLTKWRFPATNIAAGQFLMVWASDKNRRIPGAPLHTNFKLSDEGEYLALVHPDGVTIATQFSPTFVPQLSDVSYGLPSDSVTNNFLAWSTPGLFNSPGTNFIVASLEFSPGRGWFTDFVSVSIGTPTPGVTIYFTTNGTVPSPTNGFVYNSPLVFADTTVLRAAAYRPAYLPSIVTHTYVFPTQVANQTGAGFPTTWGATDLGPVPAYYTCNSNLVNDPRWGNQMPAALLSLPTLSVVMNPDDMFGTNGIYSNPFGHGVEWERPCSVEYFRPDSRPGFQINCGLRIHGAGSRNPEYTPKHSLRLMFKQIYGTSKLLFDLYPGSPVQDFDALVLHASLTDHWYVTGAAAQEQRSQWCADTQQEIGDFGTHGAYVNLYINGLYWGMYNLGERPDASYAAQYLGGNKSDYDTFNGSELMDGTTNAWNELMSLVGAGITNDIAWSNACYYLDVPNFINFLLINFYAVNTEEFDHNWWIAGSVTHGVPFHFFSWDAEDGFEAYGPLTTPITYDIIGLAEGCPTSVCVLHSSLCQYPEYRRLFGDHVQRLLFNHGALTPERGVARWMKRAREIDAAIIAESVRWGITNWWGVMVYADWILYTHDDWLAEQTYLMTNWFPRRTDMLIGQLRDAGLYPALDAPSFAPHGGIIVESLDVTITTPPGTVLYYTTNGSDPRLPDGSVAPDALVYDQGLTLALPLTSDTQLHARAFATNSWSALVAADYVRGAAVELRIDEITRQSDGAIKLDLFAWPGASYTLRASTNLESSTALYTSLIGLPGWLPIATIVPFPDGTFTFVDPAATNYPMRFYRLTWP